MCKPVHSSILILRQCSGHALPRAGYALFVWLGIALLAACTPADPPKNPPKDPPKKSWLEELVVIVTQGENSVDTEFEMQLVTLFAKQLQVKTRLLPLPPDSITPSLMTNMAHLAAAGMRSNEGGGLRFAPSYHTVSEQVVCNAPSSPRRLDGLVTRTIAVVAGSAQEEALREAQQKLPALHWDALRKKTAADLLA